MLRLRALPTFGTIALLTGLAAVSAPVHAQVFDTSNDTLPSPGGATPGVYFGTGNFNGFFQTETVTLSDGQLLELGLRARPVAIGASTTGEFDPTTGFSDTYTESVGLTNSAHPKTTWSFDFSIDISPGADTLTSLSAANLTITGPGNTPVSFNPLDLADDTIVDGSGNVTKFSGSPTDSFDLLDNPSATGLQNSEAVSFFGFDSNTTGQFTIALSATDSDGGVTANDTIFVNAVPEPATMSLLGFGLAGLATIRRRKRRA